VAFGIWNLPPLIGASATSTAHWQRGACGNLRHAPILVIRRAE